MLLKKVKIYNYRQLQEVELDLQNYLTVLAGPNNSGKTTLISVLKGMFHDYIQRKSKAISLALSYSFSCSSSSPK